MGGAWPPRATRAVIGRRGKDGGEVRHAPSAGPAVRALHERLGETVVNVRPSILCPVDFSDGSASALRHAAALAERFVARLIVLHVERPSTMRIASRRAASPAWRQAVQQDIVRFVASVFAEPRLRALSEPDMAVGPPALEILRVARERSCSLVVMGARGQGRREGLGATTQAVLRTAPLPLCVVPERGGGRRSGRATAPARGPIVVSLDVSPRSRQRALVAGEVAAAFDRPLVLVHPVPAAPAGAGGSDAAPDAERLAAAERTLAELGEHLPRGLRVKRCIAVGDAADTVAAVTAQLRPSLLVMGRPTASGRSHATDPSLARLLLRTPVLLLPDGASLGLTNADRWRAGVRPRVTAPGHV